MEMMIVMFFFFHLDWLQRRYVSNVWHCFGRTTTTRTTVSEGASEGPRLLARPSQKDHDYSHHQQLPEKIFMKHPRRHHQY